MITFLKQNNKLITTLGSGIAILKNNIENITDKGERIYLSNTIKARFKKFGITGNSKQTTREESNLYDKSKNTNSKGVDSNGEEYDPSGWTLTDYISISAENKLLKYSGLTAVGNKPHSAFYDSNKNFISSFKQAVGENTIEIPQNASYVRFTLEIASGDVNTFNVSYVAMPSLEFPSEVEAVGQDVNMLDFQITTQEINGVQFTVTEDKTVIANGTSTANASFYVFASEAIDDREELPIKNTNYILSGCPAGGSNSSYRIGIVYAKNGNNYEIIADNGSGAVMNYTNEKIGVFCEIRKGYTANNIEFKPKLARGTKVTAYSPYNCGSANITVCNKNVYDELKYPLDFNYAIDSNTGNVYLTTSGNYYTTRDYIPFSQYVNKSINLSSRRFTVVFYDKNKTKIHHITYNSTTKVVPDKTAYIRFDTHKDYVKNFSIEVGETLSTNYVKHEEQTFTVPVQQEMLEGDYLDLDSEEEVHTWGKVVLDGVNNKTNYKHDSVVTDTNGFYSIHLPGKSATYEDGNVEAIYCSHLKAKKGVAINAVKENCIWWNGGNSKYVFLSLPFLSISEANNFLQELYNAETPVTIYYKLETPTKLPFTEAQKAVAKQIRETLHSYKGGTHIFSTDEISPVFDVIAYTRK